MNLEQKMKLQRYYNENKAWLAKIALCGDPIVKSMALVVLKEGSMGREDVKERPTEEVSEKKEEVKKDEEGST